MSSADLRKFLEDSPARYLPGKVLKRKSDVEQVSLVNTTINLLIEYANSKTMWGWSPKLLVLISLGSPTTMLEAAAECVSRVTKCRSNLAGNYDLGQKKSEGLIPARRVVSLHTSSANGSSGM